MSGFFPALFGLTMWSAMFGLCVHDATKSTDWAWVAFLAMFTVAGFMLLVLQYLDQFSTRTSHPDPQPTSIQPQKDSGYETDTLKLP